MPQPSIRTDSQGSPDTGEELLGKRKSHFMRPEEGEGDKGLKQKCRNSKDFKILTSEITTARKGTASLNPQTEQGKPDTLQDDQ